MLVVVEPKGTEVEVIIYSARAQLEELLGVGGSV
jgi:hypothetical protein